MTNQTMRIFFPLKITTYLLNDYDWDDQNPVELSSEEAVSYEDAILTAITNENHRRFENNHGLAEHIENEALNKKVYSLYPSVEVSDGKLWGVMTAGLTEALSGEETTELLEFVAGENSDGYGEVFEQRPIKTSDSIVFVSFWDNDKNYSLKTEQQLNKSLPASGYDGPVMGGI
ncbi:hypothetical protein [Desulfitobacterium hafniense]|uniref:hypothetical protein n=1 Tax=Desulfitobacterium hafniense TaxID=49338 RepID=UPI0003A8C6D8|nr:hypothetical protein [Desulfitobacterium hafniense]